MKTEDTEAYYCYIYKSDLKKLRKKRQEEGTPVGWVIRKAVREYIEQQEEDEEEW